ncbi:hypothetical protein SAMN04490198_4404 [Pseudomonas palleroniana]|uniref:Uncharacterized protein n=1 Tax=Pseudomonas palleroniana TaxID=191390 RepID=A0A1H5NKC8_9PSED|nr:hypothetical protein SAMN04490198_4404 [Pseudomonas palleroniana]
MHRISINTITTQVNNYSITIISKVSNFKILHPVPLYLEGT